MPFPVMVCHITFSSLPKTLCRMGAFRDLGAGAGAGLGNF